jgi:predicted branched-subunit amino acid permease
MLLNLRFVPMGIAIAPSLRAGPLGRALRGQALVDASWALANRGGGRFDIDFLLGSTLAQYPAWVGGTALGALAGGLVGNPRTLGLDAIFPAFFLGLLVAELRRPRARPVSALGAVVALVLTPLTPAGVPIIMAAAAVFVMAGSRR